VLPITNYIGNSYSLFHAEFCLSMCSVLFGSIKSLEEGDKVKHVRTEMLVVSV